MVRLIGIAGRKGHGKDTVARMLQERGFTVQRFAGPLKAMLRAFYKEHGVDDATIERKIEGDLKEAPCPLLLGKTPRYAMQTLGTEWGRVCIHPDLWVRSLQARVAEQTAAVPDVRYPNECEAITESGGKVVRVMAHRRVPPDHHSAHTSETAVDELPVDLEIANNGTVFELEKAVGVALERIA